MIYDQDIFEREGLRFRVHIEQDDTNEAPWERDCIYDGVVTNWYSRAKKPHERLLHSDHGSTRFFDVKRFIAVAVEHGCTKKQAAEMVDESFERLRRWCNDQWCYVGVCVELIDDEDQPLTDKYDHALWGIESDCEDYLEEVAHELADHIAAPLLEEREFGELAAVLAAPLRL